MEIEITKLQNFVTNELVKCEKKMCGQMDTQYDYKTLELLKFKLEQIQEIITQEFGKKWVELSTQ